MDPRSADPSLQKTSPTHGSSGFPEEQWPSRNVAQLLLGLTQGTRSIEDYITEYLNIAYWSDLPDCVLIDFFCEGINQPLKEQLIREGPRSSLSLFLDYALLTVGSPFTVGVVEKCDTSSIHVMAAAPDDAHKMAATIITTPSQVTVDLREPSHVSSDLPEQRHVPAVLLESRYVSGSVWERSGLRSSVADPPLTSARAAGIPKPPPAASHSSPLAATPSSSSVASPSSSSVATPSSSPVATPSSSPVATPSSSPVATPSSSPDAMDKMAALPVPTGKMAVPPVSGNIGVVPASESAPPREPAAAPTEEVGTEPPPQPCKRRRRRKASSIPQGPEAVPEQPAAVPEQPAAVPEQSALPDTATEAGATRAPRPAGATRAPRPAGATRAPRPAGATRAPYPRNRHGLR
ncbi:uncharacterized protein LOC127506546 [Ctenopharyngodon idella]|uniref:uncharacterized protein LOC127506546 n=1 Tax=Ctenopharyngodon idella TaxID=7959 RepID=UPI00223024AE|nr:uncharacterized protein LOC127506546 [Ctenopharyngodon idella]